MDRLREYDRDEENRGGSTAQKRIAVLLAATDPANPYGAALPWPTPASWGASEEERTKHKPGRKAGAVVVLVNGRLCIYVERGGKTILIFTDSVPDISAASPLLGELVRRGAAENIMIEKVNGMSVLDSPEPLASSESGAPQSTTSGEANAAPGAGTSTTAQDGVSEHPVVAFRKGLQQAGFYSTPKGLRMRREY